MNYIADFLNFGTLPYVGRERYTNEILDFWRKNSESRSLRTAYVEGEAGVGKTRLIEAIIPQIVHSKGICIHIKFYPEATVSLYSLLAQALDESSAREIIKGSTKVDFAEIISNLRRISRIRNTIIFIEDAHLITTESKRELGTLLEALSTEVISIVFFSRPVDMPAKDLIELYNTDSWSIAGLTHEDMNQMWQKIFGTEADSKVIDILLNHTKGNSLAIKSALKALVKSEAIAELNGVYVIEASYNAIERTIIKCAESVADAMAFNLDEYESQVAHKLSCLGEVFSIEAAKYIAPDAEEDIKKLKFRGLIVDSHYSAKVLPSCKKSEYQALAFTHSLVHENLLKKSVIPYESLMLVIAEQAPLYSVIPFDLLSSGGIDYIAAKKNSLSKEFLLKTFFSIINISNGIDESPDWELAPRVYKVAEQFLEVINPLCSEEEVRINTAEYMGSGLNLMSRKMRTEEFGKKALEFKEYTSNYHSTRLAALHIRSYIYYNGHQFVYKNAILNLENNWVLTEPIVEKYPDIVLTQEYLDFVREFIKTYNYYPSADIRIVKKAIQKYHEIINNPNLDEKLRKLWIVEVGSSLLILPIDSDETMQERDLILKQIDGLPESRNADAQLAKGRYLAMTGRFKDSINVFTSVANLEKERGQKIGAGVGIMIRAVAKGYTGEEFKEILDDAIFLINYSKDFHRPVFYNLLVLFLVRNWDKHLAEFEDKIGYKLDDSPPRYKLFYASIKDDLERVVNKIESENLEEDPQYLAIAKMVINNEITPEAREAVQSIIDKKLFMHKDNMDKIWMLKMMALWREKKGSKFEIFSESLKSCCNQIAEWAVKYSIPPIIENIIINYHAFFDKDKLKFYRNSLNAYYKELNIQNMLEDVDSHKIKVSLFGAVSVTHPKQEPHKLRGERIRYGIGAIAANYMMGNKLELDEFNSIITGEDIPEVAKAAMRTVRHRLKELLGENAVIIKDGEPMQFNLDIVEVDIITAFQCLKSAKKNLKNKKINNAANDLHKTFELINGGVSFPGLYSNFFESLREDWENSLRDMTERICSTLLDEEDYTNAENILKMAVVALTGDDNLNFMYEQSLRKQSKNAQADVVMMKNEDY